jgi:hypothetical protein
MLKIVIVLAATTAFGALLVTHPYSELGGKAPKTLAALAETRSAPVETPQAVALPAETTPAAAKPTLSVAPASGEPAKPAAVATPTRPAPAPTQTTQPVRPVEQPRVPVAAATPPQSTAPIEPRPIPHQEFWARRAAERQAAAALAARPVPAPIQAVRPVRPAEQPPARTAAGTTYASPAVPAAAAVAPPQQAAPRPIPHQAFWAARMAARQTPDTSRLPSAYRTGPPAASVAQRSTPIGAPDSSRPTRFDYSSRYAWLRYHRAHWSVAKSASSASGLHGSGEPPL